jgi:uncharacterized membrane protein
MLLRLIGVVLLFAGATAATIVHRRYAKHLPVSIVVVVLAATGAVMGTGAALIRDFSLLPTAVFAAVVLPVVALLAAARSARR